MVRGSAPSRASRTSERRKHSLGLTSTFARIGRKPRAPCSPPGTQGTCPTWARSPIRSSSPTPYQGAEKIPLRPQRAGAVSRWVRNFEMFDGRQASAPMGILVAAYIGALRCAARTCTTRGAQVCTETGDGGGAAVSRLRLPNGGLGARAERERRKRVQGSWPPGPRPSYIVAAGVPRIQAGAGVCLGSDGQLRCRPALRNRGAQSSPTAALAWGHAPATPAEGLPQL